MKIAEFNESFANYLEYGFPMSFASSPFPLPEGVFSGILLLFNTTRNYYMLITDHKLYTWRDAEDIMTQDLCRVTDRDKPLAVCTTVEDSRSQK